MPESGGAFASRCRTEIARGVLPQDLQGNKQLSYLLHCSQFLHDPKMMVS